MPGDLGAGGAAGGTMVGAPGGLIGAFAVFGAAFVLQLGHSSNISFASKPQTGHLIGPLLAAAGLKHIVILLSPIVYISRLAAVDIKKAYRNSHLFT